MSCQCRCHAYGPGSQITCDVEYASGSSGVPGVKSCAPCDGGRGGDEQTDGPCRRCGETEGHRRLDNDCILRHRKPHTRATHGHLCETCIDKHKDWLKEIPDLYTTLDQVVLAGSISEEVGEHMRTKKAPASPSPLRLDAWALLHPWQLNEQITTGIRLPDGSYEMVEATLGANLPDVRAILARWAQRTYDHLGWGTAPSDLSGAAAALWAQADTTAALDNVTLFDAELRWIRRSLRTAHGLTDPKPLGDCLTVAGGEQCAGKVMPDRYGGRPKCTRCGRRYSDVDLVKLQITEDMTVNGS